MGKKIRIIPVWMLLMLALAGCGRQGKVSERKYIAALEAFEEYYKDELRDEYEELTAGICLDAEGMPLMFVIATDQPEGYDRVYDNMAFACVKGKVTPVMEFSGSSRQIGEGISVGIYTDGIITVMESSERREEDGWGDYDVYLDTEQTWYQIRGDKCTEIARRNLTEWRNGTAGEDTDWSGDEESTDTEENREEICFVLGKREYAVNLLEDDLKAQDNIFKKVCNKLYSVNTRGSKYCQSCWTEKLLNTELPCIFMQSLPLGYNMCNDAKSFRRQISDLKKAGSKSNDEFLIWNINEFNKKGDLMANAQYLVYRDPLLLKDVDLLKKWDENDSYDQLVLKELIAYVMATEDYRVIEQLDFIDTLSLKAMKKQAAQHFRRYLAQQDEDDANAPRIESVRESGDSVAETWYNNAISDMLEENLEGENSSDYLKAYIKYLAKKQDTVRDEFDTQEMALSAYEYMGKRDSRLKGAGFALMQLGEENKPCLLTDRGILTYDHGRIYTCFLDDSASYYWNEQTGELLFIDWSYDSFNPMTEKGNWIRAENVSEDVDYGVWRYRFRSVEGGKLIATVDYYFSYDHWKAYIRDWQENEDPEYEEMDWEACWDSLWQRRCGSTCEESGMEINQLDRETPCFSNQSDMGDRRQSTVRLYPSVEKAREKFLESGTANIEVIDPVAKEPVQDIYAPVQPTPSADYEEELPPEAASALSEIDVETEVAQIRAWFSETQSHLSEYAIETPETGVERYDSGDGSVKIVLAKGFDGRNYERDYYFHDGELYFAFIFNGGEEHRLYFSYGSLIRYIDENKNIYDYGYTEAFDDWAEWVTEEAEKYY